MPPVCSLCRHAEREAIDEALIRGKDSLRNVAKRYGTSPASLLRHRGHIPGTLALAHEAAEATKADTLLERTRSLEEDARRLLKKAEAESDYRCAIAAVKTALDVVALLHKVAAEARERESNLLDSPEWEQLRGTIVNALVPFPEAFDAVWKAVDEVAGGGYRPSVGPRPQLSAAS